MHLKFFIPKIGSKPDRRPENCPKCGGAGLRLHQHAKKNVIDHLLERVEAMRYQCKACRSTFRWYSEGVSKDYQGAAVKAMGVILYILGLS